MVAFSASNAFTRTINSAFSRSNFFTLSHIAPPPSLIPPPPDASHAEILLSNSRIASCASFSFVLYFASVSLHFFFNATICFLYFRTSTFAAPPPPLSPSSTSLATSDILAIERLFLLTLDSVPSATLVFVFALDSSFCCNSDNSAFKSPFSCVTLCNSCRNELSCISRLLTICSLCEAACIPLFCILSFISICCCSVFCNAFNLCRFS
mmetsp:Transcript_52832/g.84170  ORF Transcript_52832/g.84170 Transcript_52832/m.84170 type:complete len:209 (-) Transcript_52832:1555-2181(-)